MDDDEYTTVAAVEGTTMSVIINEIAIHVTTGLGFSPEAIEDVLIREVRIAVGAAIKLGMFQDVEADEAP